MRNDDIDSRSSVSPDSDQQRRHLGRCLAPPGLNGGTEAWLDVYTPLIVNPIGEPAGQEQMNAAEVASALEKGRLIQAIQTYSLLSNATTGLPEREETVGFEVLARIMRPKTDPAISTPRYFLSVLTPAQRKVLTAQSVQSAALIAKHMVDAGYKQFRAAGVNATEEFLEADDMEQVVLDAAEKAGVPPSLIEIEILETIAMLSSSALDAMRRLHDEHGVKFVLDDFDPGEQFSTDIRGRSNHSRELLESLLSAEFPIDGLKVPGECVCGISTRQDPLRREEAVVSILGAAKALQVRRVIFEGGPAGVTRYDADVLLELTRKDWAEKQLWFEGSLKPHRTKKEKEPSKLVR